MKLELLAPAGDLSRLRVAVQYGADAVYLAGKAFGLRTACQNFSEEELAQGIEYCHERGVRVYVTVNTYPRNDELQDLPGYLETLCRLGADAVLVSDPGVFRIARAYGDRLELHISTQANNVNYASACFWQELGAKRIVLARELSLPEIRTIREKTPPGLELEAFVHGAMCISYSGRCLLSNYMAHRDSNRGDCAQPCRWKYFLREEKREGQQFELEEDGGTFLFNSKDLCLIRRLPELARAGVTSFKIEGRVKSEYYLATVLSAYRQALDAYERDPEGFHFEERWYEEVCKVSHREYYEGFLDGDTGEGQTYESSSYLRDYEVVALVEGYDRERHLLRCRQRNKFYEGDELELLMPGRPFAPYRACEIYSGEGERMASTPHADQTLLLPCPFEVPENSFLRKAAVTKKE